MMKKTKFSFQIISAVLAAGRPDVAPFMADECIMSMPEYDGLDYTMKEYMRYVEYVKTCVERLNSQSPGEFFLDFIFNVLVVTYGL